MIQNKNIKLILNYFGGPLLFCILLFAIRSQLTRQSDWKTSLDNLHSALTSSGTLTICVVMALMILNWSIESLKWKIIMSREVNVSFASSFRAILAGNALALFTPNRTGEYFGRMLYLKKGVRLKSIPLTVVCSYSQVLVTLLAGSIGLFVFGWFRSTALVILSATAVLTILYFSVPSLGKRLKRIRLISRWTRHLAVLEDVNATILFQILSLSVTRYVVFIVQYFVLFRVFGVNIDWWQAFWAVSVVFLVIAVLPSLGFLSEAGIRWQAGIQVLQALSSNITGIFATSLAIWLINLVIPAIAGGVLILALKLFDNKTDCNQAGFT